MTQSLIAATVRLASTLAAENAALQALDLPGAASMLAEKEEATAAFAAARGTVAPALSAALRQAALHLVAQAEENRRLLEHAIAVQKRVLGVVANAASAPSPVSRYGRSGAYAGRPTPGRALSARA